MKSSLPTILKRAAKHETAVRTALCRSAHFPSAGFLNRKPVGRDSVEPKLHRLGCVEQKTASSGRLWCSPVRHIPLVVSRFTNALRGSQGSTESRPTGSFRKTIRHRAFTLIELLVVISIIAALAALTLTVLPGTKTWRVRRAVEAQMQQLELAIQNYKDTRGYYPPSNPRSSSTNVLFYELVGAQEEQSGKFVVMGRTNTIFNGQIAQLYGDLNRRRILNSASPDAPPNYNDPDANTGSRSFHAEIKDNQTKTTADGITLLAVPAPGTNGDFNVWNYVAPGIHNPERFDLWTVVKLGKKTNLIANWKE